MDDTPNFQTSRSFVGVFFEQRSLSRIDTEMCPPKTAFSKRMDSKNIANV
jgi:hypothetical protein